MTKKPGRPVGRKQALPPPEKLWLGAWTLIAALDRYDAIYSSGKKPDSSFANDIRKWDSSFDKLMNEKDFGDRSFSALVCIKKHEAALANIYKFAKTTKNQIEPSKVRLNGEYQSKIRQLLISAGLDSSPGTVRRFALPWTRIGNPIQTARKMLAEQLGLRASGDKSIRKKLKETLFELPTNQELLSLLKPLLATIGYSEREIQSAIGMLSLDLEGLHQ